MINRTQYAVLGALAEGPRSVYSSKKDLEATVGLFWHESYGQCQDRSLFPRAGRWIIPHLGAKKHLTFVYS